MPRPGSSRNRRAMPDPRKTVNSETRPANKRRVRSLLLLLALLALPAGAADLVIVERPVDSGALGSPFGRCVSESRLVILGADGQRRVITPDFDGACDPSISFDGLELLFTGRKLDTETWQVWKMDLTTGETTKITDHPGDAFAATWVGSIFHLDDEAPTQRIAYLATTPRGRRMPALHTSNLDGSKPLRISYTDDMDAAPDVLPNGRIVYPTMRGLGHRHLNLMGLNIDGTDLAVFADPHDVPRDPHAVRVGFDGKVYFIEAVDRFLDGGTLASVALRRPLRTRSVVATTENGLFLDPAPMADGSLLASFLAIDSAGYELVLMEPETGRIIETVHRSEGVHVLDAQEITPRPVVPGRSTVVDTRKTTGVFFCISSHITDRPSLTHLGIGGAKRLRVLESQSDRHPPRAHRILGEAPIEADGSFHIEVPAQRPLRFLLLDDEGTVLGEQKSWTWVMPREWRGCIGCHENREMVAPNILADAVVKPAVPIGIPSNDPEEGE